MGQNMTVWTNAQLDVEANAVPSTAFPLPNLSGCSILINNNSRWYVNVMQTGVGTPIDTLEPFSFVIYPNNENLSVQIDTTKAPSSLNPDTQSVSYSTMTGTVAYQKGSTQFSGSTSTTITGPVTIDAIDSTIQAEIVGDVNATISGPVSLAAGTTVEASISGPVSLAEGTQVEATISGPVSIATGSTVEISGGVDVSSMPAVTFAAGQSVTVESGTMTISGTPSVTLTGSENTVNIGNTPAVTIEGAVATEIQGTPGVTIEGTPTVNLAAGQVVEVQNSAGGQLTVAGSVTANLPAGTAVDINTGSVEITNAVQTNNLVQVGTFSIPVSELANTETVSGLLSGNVTGYWQTLILEGQSQNGYTYNAAASAYNRATNIGAASLTQSNGPSGQFYASGNLSARQAFSNVDVTLTAEVTAQETIFSDPMTTGTNWATEAGSVAYGANGATFGANGTVLAETTQTGLVPQNLTLQAQFAVSNTSSTGSFSPTPYNEYSAGAAYTYGSPFSVNKTITLNTIGFYNGGTSGEVPQISITDSSGNIIVPWVAVPVNNIGLVQANVTSVILTTGKTYWFNIYYSSSYPAQFDSSESTSVINNGVTLTLQNKMWQISNGGSTSNLPQNGTNTSSTQGICMYLGFTVGSHSTIGVEYYNASNNYYEFQWSGGNLNIVENKAGTITTLASTPCTETATSVTAKLVVASNGNITGTLTGNQVTQVTVTNTDIQSGQLAVTGDSGVVTSNAFISGNYIPSDVVTITAYAV